MAKNTGWVQPPRAPRANVFTRAGRWLAGAFNGTERRNPSTGEKEHRSAAPGSSRRWIPNGRNIDDVPRPTHASQHPKPPKQLTFRASRPVGVGARIGIGEGIGTLVGTPVDTNSPTSWFAGAGGTIGMRIAGSDEVAEEAIGGGGKSQPRRGGASGGGMSGS